MCRFCRQKTVSPNILLYSGTSVGSADIRKQLALTFCFIMVTSLGSANIIKQLAIAFCFIVALIQLALIHILLYSSLSVGSTDIRDSNS